ncbi:MAG: tRNA (N6-isopentenyl adenosine(37)-C2)-methylthiotransferase MiaB [Holosporales bacterium]|jgi:tRNA-2-methylthio-N6-dimethylallyladenosine synthase|nr:tRNA (N6-isopentenyl adenosine(37)-C2)-methylthiotransferase MiaB [Holosporales bacterium]
MKSVWLKNFGCQMNAYDAARLIGVLQECGYHVVKTPKEAHVIILNTCHIRRKATEKVFSDLGRLRVFKEGPLASKIVVMGCVAQALGEEILRRAPWVDLVVGPQAVHKIPSLLAALPQATGYVFLDGSAAEKFQKSPLPTLTATNVTVFLPIQEGCDNCCTYCVVPHTRGREFSRPVSVIIEEARSLLQQGVKEITLIGQNVNAYRGEEQGHSSCDFGALLFQIANLPGLLRLRYTTSHPQHINDSLLHAHATLPQLMPFVHLPAQSGSDRILKAMHRPYTRAGYLDAIDKLRSVRSDMAFSSDFIVGFPGETEQDFLQTLSLVESVAYAQAYAFKYSSRARTPAASFPDPVPEPVKEERLARLLDALRAQQCAFNQQSLEQVVPVLFEKPGRYEGEIVGRTPYFQPVSVCASQDRIGHRLLVHITKVLPHSLKGVVEEPIGS